MFLKFEIIKLIVIWVFLTQTCTNYQHAATVD